MNSRYYFNFCLLIFSVNITFAAVSDTLPNNYQLRVLNSTAEYIEQTHSAEENEMVDIKKIIPDIRLELVYTTADNFTHSILYPQTKTTFLRKPAALALKKVQDSLRKLHLSLKIWDAYRPYAVTLKMWDLIHDDRYVADPSKGSGHNKGIAVDLTIVSTITGKELDMGTGFDDFSDSAHQDFMQLPETVLNNRKLLRSLMTENGFIVFETEWWHYFFGTGRFDIMDIPFEDFLKLSKTKAIKKR